MKKGRDTFTFQLKEPDKAQSLINEWLQTYKFVNGKQKGESCYVRIDPVTSCAFFNYQIQGNQVTLQIWQHGAINDISIYKGINIMGTFYCDIMDQLLEKISSISINQAPIATLAQNGVDNMNPQTNNSQNFHNLSNKTDEKLCIVGFVMALINIILVLLDGSIALGGLGYIILFICGARGLKTQKRNLAIATIILGVISLAIFIIKIIVAVLE